MERAVQIYAIINLTVIGISHVARPGVWVNFFVVLRKRGEAGVFAVAFLNLIFGSIIVAFSWWGVNQLGVGLHSYGFTQGISFALLCFYGIEAITLCLGAFAWFRDRIGANAADAGVARHAASPPPALPTSMPGDGVQSPG